MKRLLFIPAAVAATAFALAETKVKGDVNGDGEITMADANAIINYCNGNTPEGFNADVADVNNDGVITNDDAKAVVDIFLGLKQSDELEEMTGAAMYVKMNSGETAVIDVATITDRCYNEKKDSLIITTSAAKTAFAVADIAERTYGDMPAKLTVNYSNESASVVNPYYTTGVRATIDGGNVTINNSNTTTEYTFALTGETSNGSLLYNGEYKATFQLNGVSINNPNGAAVDIECGKRINLELVKGTTSTLTDGKDGKQKAALYCKGHLEIDKAGTLNVTGNTAHAISAKEYIQLKKANGTINILGAVKDGMHCKQYYLANGYTINIKGVGDDGIQAELDGEANDEGYDDGSVIIKNGTYTISNDADGGKGITADGPVNISGETTVIDITANGAGGVVKAETSGSEEETVKQSYRVYVSLPTTGSTGGFGPQSNSNYWKSLYLYNSSGTLVATLSSTVSKTSGSTTKTFYYYDFKTSDSGTYYFMSDNYTSSMGGRPGGGSSTSYTIKSSTFSGPTSGEDYYYEISNSYSTSGTTRTFSLSNVTNTWNGSTSDTAEETGEAISAAGIKADGNITISEGTITVKNSGEMSKSIKSKATVQIDGGTLTLTPSGAMKVINSDASYSTGVKAVDFIQNGGALTINASGAAGRGVSAENVTTNGGSLDITNSGNGQSGSNDSYTAKGIKADTKVALNGGTVKIAMSGTGGKGIKSSGTYTQGVADGTGPELTVSTTGASFGSSSSSSGGMGGFPGGGWGESTGSSAKGIKVQGAITVYGGNSYITTATNGAEGMESKTSINIAGGTHYFKTYDDCINCSGIINFSGGTTACYATNNDAVDSNYGRSGAITVSGGNIFAYTSAGSPEEGLDCDNNSYITVTGGIAVSAGGAQGGGSSSSIGSATQGYYIGSSPSSYSSSYYYTLCNTSGTPICTFKFASNVTNSLGLLTASNLGKGSVTVKQGTAKPIACDVNVNDVFFINPTVTTTSTTATLTAK